MGDDAYERGRVDALAAVQAARDRARTTSEYANGYNSAYWVDGRLEGFDLAISAIEGAALPGQWSDDK